ncbi:MAG: HNH endonuclease [Cyanobacteria bacterium P01_G01_bin.54]
MGKLEIEHLIPLAKGGTDDEINLWLACRLCNAYKGIQTDAIDPLTGASVSLFNPRLQVWHEHFSWSSEGVAVMGKTACGRATVAALQLNNDLAILVRGHWVNAGWHPPQD